MIGRHILVSIRKELKLLRRDRAGIFLLFIMPAFLVILITLIQDRVTNTTVDVLFIDHDNGEVSRIIRDLFALSEEISLIEQEKSKKLNNKEAAGLLAKGDYQFAIILPKGLSEAANKNAARRIAAASSNEKIESNPEPQITILFDPTVQGGFRTAVVEALQRVTQGIQYQFLFHYGTQKLLQKLPAEIRAQLPPQGFNLTEELPQIYDTTPLISIKEQFATGMNFIRQPTAVQQNVPAWAIFGIFLIVVPLSGSIIRERNSGINKRLQLLPTSYYLLATGKLLAYILISLIQFLVILAAGIFILPLFGTDSFSPGNSLFLFAILVVAVSTAACGYGIFLGNICRTYEQTAVIGPVSVVIASAIGGVMVPVYALPESLKLFSNLSPLYWAQNGFYDLLLRDGTTASLIPEFALLFGFSFIMIVLSAVFARKKG